MIEVIIPVHNRRDITIACLQRLSIQKGAPFHVTVVDDGSSDGTSEVILRDHPEVTLLSGDGELWWAGAVNLGVRHSLASPYPPDSILLLNDDVDISDTYIDEMARCARQNPGALIGSLAVYFDDPGRVFWCGDAASHRECTVGYLSRASLAGCVPAKTIPGRGMLVPSKVFTEVGYIDAKTFPQYCADADFSLRAKDKGYRLLCNCDTQVVAMTRETGTGSVHRKESFVRYIQSYVNNRSPNYLPMLWQYYTRHGGPLVFAEQVSRRLAGDFLRRTGLRKRPY